MKNNNLKIFENLFELGYLVSDELSNGIIHFTMFSGTEVELTSKLSRDNQVPLADTVSLLSILNSQ